MKLTIELKSQYRELWDDCEIKQQKLEDVKKIVGEIIAHKEIYKKVSDKTNVPYYVIGMIHWLEGSGNFKTHLANGDPISAPTRHVPKGIPAGTWTECAIAAIKQNKLNQWKDWSLEGMLFRMECYNGLGTMLHHSGHNSAYIWSASTQETKGKYIADGKWSSTAISKQIGVAAMLKLLESMGEVEFDESNDLEPEVDLVLPDELIGDDTEE